MSLEMACRVVNVGKRSEVAQGAQSELKAWNASSRDEIVSINKTDPCGTVSLHHCWDNL